MNLVEVTPKPRSLTGLVAGDSLFHFRVDSEANNDEVYYVAVHFSPKTKTIQSMCGCMDALVVFPNMCKHQKAASELLIAKLKEKK